MKKYEKDIKRLADEEGRKMVSYIEAGLTERVFEAHQFHSKSSKLTVERYTSCWDSKLEELKQELAFSASGPAVLTEYLRSLLMGLGKKDNLEGQLMRLG